MGTERRANTVDATELAGRLELGRVNLNTLLGNESVRSELQETAQRAIRGQLDSPRPPPIPATISRTFVQALDAGTAAAFRQRGVAALAPQHRDALAALLANARLQELRGMADQKGYISGARAAQVFNWIDNFDRNGSARTFDIFTPESAAAAQPQLTDAGQVFKRILESTEGDMQFTEDEFVAGFMNGAFNPERFRALRPEQVEALRTAGIYDQLAARLKDSQLPQGLSPEALSRMFRRIDTVDTDGDGRTMTARGPGAAAQRETPFPLQSRATPDAEQNQTYRTMRVLRDLFDQRAAPGRGQAQVDTLVPPPANDLTESPLRGRDQPLASRTAIDLDTFSNYGRDARINLATIELHDPAAWRQLTEAFTAAGVSVDELRRLATNDVIGGSSDRDASGAAMQRLHALLASNRFGGQRGVIRPWASGPDGARTAAGRVLEVLDRHFERFNLTTRQDLARDLAAGRLQPARLNNEIETPNGQRRVSDLLREAGVDVDQLTRNGRSSADLASYLYETFGAQEANRAPGMRPNTLNLGSSRNGQTVETQAGRALGLIRRHLLQGYDQQFRAYTNAAPSADQALVDSGVRAVRIPTQFSGYRDSDPAGCFRRAAETIASSGVARTSPSGGTNHYLANSSDNVLGAIRAEARHLEQGRAFIDGMLNQGLPVQIAVMRRGSPGAAAGNPGSGVRHSLVVDERGVDRIGRVFYEGWDNATGSRENGRIRFYVDPRTNLLYAPANPTGPVYLSQGGYQVSLVKVPIWVRTPSQLPGTRSDGRGGYVVSDPDAFFHNFTQANIQGPMIAAPVQRTRHIQVAQR